MKTRAELRAIRNSHEADCGCEDCNASRRLPGPDCPAWADGEHYFIMRPEMNEAGHIVAWPTKRCACGLEIRRT